MAASALGAPGVLVPDSRARGVRAGRLAWVQALASRGP